MGIYRDEFRPAVEALRSKHFPEHDKEDPVILHREEIKSKRGYFAPLQEEARRVAFDDDLLSLVGGSRYRVITVVLDKRMFFARCGDEADPYIRCLWELLDGYLAFLRKTQATGDVLGEARKEHLDQRIRNAYKRFYDFHTGSQMLLTSKEVKLKPKANDILGTQLADLLAYPTKQEILLEAGLLDEPGVFTRRIWEMIKDKFVSKAFVQL